MGDALTQYYVGFSLINGIGRVRIGLLNSFFGNLKEAWHASAGDLRTAGLDTAVVQSIVEARTTIDLDAEMNKMERAGVRAFSYEDEGYPSRLKEIFDFPPVLYIRGALLPEDEWSISVVGTRKATVYGKQVAEDIATDIARSGITVISGMARGIDTVAHKSALAAGGRTIAVFGCGLDTIYPPENRALAQRIVENGAIISEYPLGTRPRPDYFPRRNRIMSGMSLGVLVIEAGESSGAMITANMALEQNREVFAVPGSILSPVSRGTNRLIQDGAKLVTGYRDILEELNLTVVTRQIEMKTIEAVTYTEAGLLSVLGADPVHIDEICRLSGIPVATVSSALAMMELKGLVRQMGTMSYTLAREAREEYKVKID